MDERIGYRKPEKTKDEDRAWAYLVYMSLGVVVLAVLAIWVGYELSGDKAMWRPILYAWAGIAVVLCFQAAYTEWSLSRQEKQENARHTEIVCLLTEISRKLGSKGAGDK